MGDQPKRRPPFLRWAVAVVGLVLLGLAYGRHVNTMPKVGDEWSGGQVVVTSTPLTGYIELEGSGGRLAAEAIEQRLQARARKDLDVYGMIVGFGVSVFDPDEG